jgi:hypothetical protein
MSSLLQSNVLNCRRTSNNLILLKCFWVLEFIIGFNKNRVAKKIEKSLNVHRLSYLVYCLNLDINLLIGDH